MLRSGAGKAQPSESDYTSHPENTSFVPRSPTIAPGDDWGFEEGSAHESSSVQWLDSSAQAITRCNMCRPLRRHRSDLLETPTVR